MPVYVDDMEASYGRMKMFHMVADTSGELFEMAKAIGVPVRWIQCEGTYKEHFDICRSMKIKALILGAVPVTQRELMSKIISKKGEK